MFLGERCEEGAGFFRAYPGVDGVVVGEDSIEQINQRVVAVSGVHHVAKDRSLIGIIMADRQAQADFVGGIIDYEVPPPLVDAKWCLVRRVLVGAHKVTT